MLRSRWGIVAALMAIGGLGVAMPAWADGGLSLTISSPRIEGSPITFTVSGVAGPAAFDGESTDFVMGAVLHRSRSCPAGGADTYGDIPGSVFQTVWAFPIGAFDRSVRVKPTGVNAEDLLAGDWHECAYLQDRETNAVLASAQEDFTIRKPHVGVRLLRLPRHLRFFYDTVGRPTANTTFFVWASSPLVLRTVQVGIERPGERKPCTGDMSTAKVAVSDLRRVKTGPARTYRLPTTLVFPPGRVPYGVRVRVCAVVAYTNPSSGTQALEGAAQTSLLIRR